MKAAIPVPNVVEACSVEGRVDLLKGMTKNLELCQKSLNEYLDMKKRIFPRFYFVSNVALLDILSNGNNPLHICQVRVRCVCACALPVCVALRRLRCVRHVQHLGDCYDSINKLKFEPAADPSKPPNVATTMIAKDGEIVHFPTPFVIAGAVENWLNDLTRVQQNTLAYILNDAFENAANWESEVPRHLWLKDLPAQIVLTCTQIYWTEELQQALEELEGGLEDAVKKYQGVCNDRLERLILMVLGDLSREMRTKVISLITMDVHGTRRARVARVRSCWSTCVCVDWFDGAHASDKCVNCRPRHRDHLD